MEMKTRSTLINFTRRTQSVGAAHTLLSESRWQAVSLDALVHAELAPYTTGRNVNISGTDVMLSAAETQALAKVLHELATNAAKYGALSIPGGRVSVSWEREPNGGAANLILEWRELGGPGVISKLQSRLRHQPDTRADPSRTRRQRRSRVRGGRGVLQN
jgi:two-component sensor histidine kinase